MNEKKDEKKDKKKNSVPLVKSVSAYATKTSHGGVRVSGTLAPPQVRVTYEGREKVARVARTNTESLRE